ncbi:conserved protein of unknown function [Tenacibaculum sp. 190524A02b]|uniref:Lipoprotein n=1 Tax=Tenacibaculum vairaonense TaxID=3137860 RepID=A0ABM9PR52_9FLAO
MKTYIFLLASFIFIVSCSPEKKGDPDRFKKGVFEFPSIGNISKIKITRVDSLQIEEYTEKISTFKNSISTEKIIKHIDTFYIKWKNNFNYTCIMKNPRTNLDKDPIFVQITKVKDNSYDFSLRVGYSNFKQKGTVHKVK